MEKSLNEQVINKFEWFGLHKILRVISIEGKFINDEPLRIGAGRAKSLFEPVDLVVEKYYDSRKGCYVPYIPGSSLKGTLRSTCVRIAYSYGINVCHGTPNNTCLSGNEFDNIEKKSSGYVSEIVEKIRAIMRGEIRVCLGCLVFGSSGIASHLEVQNSVPLSDYKLGYRTCVAIDRRTGAAAYRALYSVEFVEPGTLWNFRLDLINLPNYAIGWLCEALYEIHKGIVKIGGFKSRGYGKIHFEELEFSIYSLNHREYGIYEHKIRGIDAIDSNVDIQGEIKEEGVNTYAVKGQDAWKLLSNFIKCWHEKLDILRKIHEKRIWEVALSG